VLGRRTFVILEAGAELGSSQQRQSRQAARRLSTNGMLVMKFSGEPERYITHMKQIRAAIDGSTLLVPVIADDNLLLFALKKRIGLPTTAQYESRAQRLQSRFALEFPRYLRRICQGHVLA